MDRRRRARNPHVPSTVPTPPSPPPAAGVPFGRYALRKRLARGGMGEVFLADQLGPLGPVRPVALKRLLPRVARRPDAARMFLDEMATAARLHHPNIAVTYDFGEIDGTYFLAMEYVEGLSLQELLRALGPLPVPEAIEIVLRILDALDHAHERRGPDGQPAPVVHRDVSPHNVMVSTAGAVKLLDFGIARAEDVALGGRAEGKLAYAAPEQIEGRATDRRADVWAVGVVLYEVLTGARPFSAAHPAEAIAVARAGLATPAGQLRPEAARLDPLIARALAPEPEARWPTVAAFRAALLAGSSGLEGRGPEALAELVARAGGPSKTSLGVEHITNLAVPAASTETGVAVGHTGTQGPADGTPTPSIPAARPPSQLATRILPPARPDPLAPRPLSLPGRTPRAPLPARRSATERWAVGLGAVALITTGAVLAALATRPRGFEDEALPEPRPVVASSAPDAGDAPLDDPDAGPGSTLAVVAAPEPDGGAPPEPSVDAGTTARLAAPDAGVPRSGRPRRRPARPRAPAVSVSPEPRGPGRLSIVASPWSEVEVDGVPRGPTPLVNLGLEPGRHRLRLRPSTGGPPLERTIEIRPERETFVKVDHARGSFVATER